jgi:hypothetical protein
MKLERPRPSSANIELTREEALKLSDALREAAVRHDSVKLWALRGRLNMSSWNRGAEPEPNEEVSDGD